MKKKIKSVNDNAYEKYRNDTDYLTFEPFSGVEKRRLLMIQGNERPWNSHGLANWLHAKQPLVHPITRKPLNLSNTNKKNILTRAKDTAWKPETTVNRSIPKNAKRGAQQTQRDLEQQLRRQRRVVKNRLLRNMNTSSITRVNRIVEHIQASRKPNKTQTQGPFWSFWKKKKKTWIFMDVNFDLTLMQDENDIITQMTWDIYNKTSRRSITFLPGHIFGMDEPIKTLKSNTVWFEKESMVFSKVLYNEEQDTTLLTLVLLWNSDAKTYHAIRDRKKPQTERQRFAEIKRKAYGTPGSVVDIFAFVRYMCFRLGMHVKFLVSDRLVDLDDIEERIFDGRKALEAKIKNSPVTYE